MDVHTTLPWEALCAEVSKLRLGIREGRALELRQVASAACDTRFVDMKKPPRLVDWEALAAARSTGLETSEESLSSPVLDRNQADSGQVEAQRAGPGGSFAESGVTVSHDDIRRALDEARHAWARSADREALRKALLALLQRLGGVQ
jgi:hypothetical protein